MVWAQQRLCCRFYCCWCCYYTTVRGLRCPNFRRWCRLYAADFTAVGAAITLRSGAYAAQIFAVGVGVMLPILLVLVLLLYYGSALRCPKFRRWCRRYAVDFTAVGAAITLRLGLMLHKFSALV